MESPGLQPSPDEDSMMNAAIGSASGQPRHAAGIQYQEQQRMIFDHNLRDHESLFNNTSTQDNSQQQSVLDTIDQLLRGIRDETDLQDFLTQILSDIGPTLQRADDVLARTANTSTIPRAL